MHFTLQDRRSASVKVKSHGIAVGFTLPVVAAAAAVGGGNVVWTVVPLEHRNLPVTSGPEEEESTIPSICAPWKKIMFT